MILPQPSEAFAWVQSPTRWGLICRPLEPLARHVFTNRSWLLGSSAAPGPDAWSEIADGVGTDPDRLLRVRQVHGADVLLHRAAGPPVSPGIAADIIAGDDASTALAIVTADCVPLLIGDVRTGAVAAAHAGWRGTALRVAAAAVHAMTTAFGSRPADLVAAIGPSIGPCCYEVGVDVRERFVGESFQDAELARWFSTEAGQLPANPPMARRTTPQSPDALFLNLWKATRDQLVVAGVRPHHIFIAELCTASHAETLCSYRRDGQNAGRLAAVIRKHEPGSRTE
ncbi:MAG: peptidoglycan editing factor PgeF [Acidobacteriota bacterium]